MTSILGSLSFAKLVMMSSAPAKFCGGGGVPDTCPKSLSFMAINIGCPIQSYLQSVLGVSLFYVECRRTVGSVGRAPGSRAGGRGTKPRPDQHSGSLNN